MAGAQIGVHQACLFAPERLATGGGEALGVDVTVAGKRVALGGQDDGWGKVGEVGVLQRGVMWIAGDLLPGGADKAVECHVFGGEARRLWVVDIGLFGPIGTQAWVDQECAGDAVGVVGAGLVGNRGHKAAARTVTTQHDRARKCRTGGREGRPGVVEVCRIGMFGREAVINGQDAHPSGGTEFGADTVVTVETTDNKASAVAKEDSAVGSGRGRIEAAGDIAHAAI